MAFLFFLGSTGVCAQSIGLGAGPSDLLFKNLVRGGYSEDTIDISTTADTNLNVRLTAEGSIASWITLNTTDFVLPPRGRTSVSVVLRPPPDASNGEYSGKIYVAADPISNVTGGSGSVVGTRVVVNVKAEVSGVETFDYVVTDASVFDTEVGYPIQFHLSVRNNGNVKTRPNLKFVVTGPSNNPGTTVVSRNLTEILPSRSITDVVTIPSSSMDVGGYVAEVGYFLKETDASGKLMDVYVVYGNLSFNILSEGAVSAKGRIDSLVLDKTQASVGDTVKINAVFSNTGEMMLQAALVCEVVEGYRLEAKLDGKELSTYPGQSKSLAVYYMPRNKGEYDITCYVTYGGFETEKKSSGLKVVGGLGLSNFSDLLLILILFIGIFVIYKKGYLTPDGKKEKLEET